MNQHLIFISLYSSVVRGGTVEETEGREGTESGTEVAMMTQEAE